MSLRQIFTRFTGTGTRVSPEEAELRRLSQAGDEARRNHEPDRALQLYQEGLAHSRSANFQQGQEVFLGLIGALHTEQGHYEEAKQALEEALTLATQSGQGHRRARAVLNMGAYYLSSGDLPTAQKSLQEALDLGRQANDPITIGLALGNMADVYMKQSNPAYALRLLKEAAPQIMQNSEQASYLMGRIGQAHLAVGETERGRKALAQAIRLAERHEQPGQQLLWSSVLADQLYKDGQLGDALQLYQRVEQLSKTNTSLPRESVLRGLLNQGVAYQKLGEHDKAMSFGLRAIEQARVAEDTETEAQALLIVGNAQKALGHVEEAIQSFNKALELYQTRTYSQTEHINTLLALGNLYQDQGQTDRALSIFDQALSTAGAGDKLGRAQTLRRIGSILQIQNQPQVALEKWIEALALFEQSGETAHAARLLCDIGALRRAVSGFSAALPDYERATVLLNGVKDANTRGLVLSNVANLYTDLGEVETAQSFYQESIQLARQLGNRRAEGLRIGNLGWFQVITGHPEEGMKSLEEALALSQQLNDQLLIAVQTSNLAHANHELKNYAKAIELYQQAINIADKLPEPRWGAMFRSNLARTLLAQGKTDDALKMLEQVLPISRAAGDQETVARTLTRLADSYFRQGRLSEADTAAREADAVARKWGYRKGQADVLMVRAGIAKAQNELDTSTRYLREARKLYGILHDPLAEELARQLGE